MRAVAVDVDAVLGDTRPLWRAWLEDAARRFRMEELAGLPEDRVEAAAELDRRLPSWQALLERFAEEHAPVHLRPRSDVNAALRRLQRLSCVTALLRLWRETGATILLITHALDEAAMLADHVGVMSARPGRFLDIVSTGWPRERDSTIVGDPAFGALTSRIWMLLRGESLPIPDPNCTDPEADLEEPIHLLLTAAARVALVPQSSAP